MGNIPQNVQNERRSNERMKRKLTRHLRKEVLAEWHLSGYNNSKIDE